MDTSGQSQGSAAQASYETSLEDKFKDVFKDMAQEVKVIEPKQVNTRYDSVNQETEEAYQRVLKLRELFGDNLKSLEHVTKEVLAKAAPLRKRILGNNFRFFAGNRDLNEEHDREYKSKSL